MDSFHANALSHFMRNMIAMLEFQKERFPTCESTSAALVKLTGVVAGNSEREKELIARWHKNMQTPIKKAKYLKPVERILHETPTCYVACAYRDIDAILGALDMEDNEDRKLLERFRSDRTEEADRAFFWKLVGALNRAALDYHDVEMQRVPSREEIQENITRHRQSKEVPLGGGSMTRALCDSLKEIAEVLVGQDVRGAIAFRDYAQKVEPADVQQAWTTMLDQTPDMEAACSKAMCSTLSDMKWSALPAEHADCLRRGFELEEHAKVICGHLHQMNSFTRVRAHFPCAMMGTIENYALKLVDDLKRGKCQMDTINMEQIGREVLAQCSTEDMSHLVSNIDKLMPALSGLHSA